MVSGSAVGFSLSLRYAVLAVIVGLIGALTAALSPSSVPMLLLCGASAVFLLLQHPGARRVEYVLLAIIVLCSTIIDIDTLPLIPIGIGSLNPADMLLALLIGLIGARLLFDPTFRPTRTRLTAPLLLFLALAVVSCVNALLLESGTRHRILSELRTLSFLLLLWVVPQYIRTHQQIRFLLRGLTLLAVLCALIMLAQAFLGPSVELIPAKLVSVNTEVYAETGLFRVTPPAQALIRACLILLAVEWLFMPPERRPEWLIPALIILGLGLLVTGNRNYWLGTALSLGAAVIILDPQTRFAALRGFVRLMIVGAAGAVIAFALLDLLEVPLANQLLETTLLRLDLNSDVANTESSWETRQDEFYYLFRQIEAHPLIGIGLGANYQPLRWYESPEFNRQYYTHNAYLWIVMKMGITGFLAFLWLIGAFVRQALTHFAQPRAPLERSVILGGGALMIGLLFSAPFSPVFLEWFWTPLIGLTMGLGEAALHMEASR